MQFLFIWIQHSAEQLSHSTSSRFFTFYVIRTVQPRFSSFVRKLARICCRCEFSANIRVIFRSWELFKSAVSGGRCRHKVRCLCFSKFRQIKVSITQNKTCRGCKWCNLYLRQLRSAPPTPFKKKMSASSQPLEVRCIFDFQTERVWASKLEKRVFLSSMCLVTLLPIWLQQTAGWIIRH